MKNNLNNIDEVFKQAFDGFEANVDSGVWNNVQNSINSGSGVGVNPTSVVKGIGAKVVALKIVAGVVLLGTIISSTVYFMSKDNNNENVVADNNEKTVVDAQTQNTQPLNEVIVLPKIEKESTDKVDKEGEIEVPLSSIPSEEAKQNEAPKGSEDAAESNGGIGNDAEDKADLSKNTPPKKVESKDAPPTTTPEKTSVLKAVIVADNNTGKAPLDVQFDVKGNAISYSWDFGDGKKSTSKDPINTYFEPGTYRVTLVVMDENLKTKTIPYLIEVESDVTSTMDTELDVLSAISPNGDGNNDEIKIHGEYISVFKATVRTLSGKGVYEWFSLDSSWKGTDQAGNKLPNGTYFLQVEAIGEDGKKHSIKKTISLFR